MLVNKAIFPVASLGTRFLPATKAQPKEMLPVVDKPLIQYAVEEAYAAGVREMIFVTGRHKRPIEDHFDMTFELEVALEQAGKQELLDVVRSVKPATTASPTGGSSMVSMYGLTMADHDAFEAMLGDSLVRQVPMRTFTYEVWGGERNHQCRVIGTTEDYTSVNKLDLAAGRFLSAEDNNRRLNHAVLASRTADPDARAIMGHALIQLDEQYETGMAVARQAVSDNANSITVLTYAGISALRSCEFEAAETWFMRAIDLNVADKTRADALTIDDAQNVVAAAGTLRASVVKAGGNAACKVICYGIKRA